MIDGNQIKKDFPIYRHQPNLVYLDTTATSLKPQQVIDKENEYYTKYSANIFRGIYKISEKATEEYERVREKIAHFIGAKSAGEIVFVRNATEAINLVAAGRITSEGKLDEKDLLGKINNKTRMVAFTHVSNVLGTINPVKTLIKKIKAKNPHCLILVDGAQAAAHFKIDVRDLGCDFYVFSSHKMLGPTGVGVLWGRYELLDNMNPYQYGGEMISAVYVDRTEFKDPPHKFEAGTPHIAGVIGLGAAIDYLRVLGMDKVRQHEIEMTSYALKLLRSLKGLKIYGPQNPENRGGVIAFTIERIHAHDIAQILDSNNICIRAGHHCAMPLHLSLDVASEKETKEKTNP
ncbi:MAG: Cysteine desulfurase [Candidatus Gottesmanbacteria bacterium GW2011_GWA2_42_16]|nr:MAG: Cysteine desulfurase [Candidatus Gottesmanbacteria bacterium GW2011_GWA2_42_16]